MRVATVALFFAVLAVVPPSHGQLAAPSLTTVTVSAAVIASNGMFTYSYSVANSAASTAPMWVLEIDISRPPAGVLLSDQGLTSGPGFLVDMSNAIVAQPQSKLMIPVGVQTPPSWTAGLSVSGYVQWSADDYPLLVLPGQAVSGYMLTSYGLPAIRTFIAEPHLDPNNLPFPPPSDPSDLPRYLNAVTALENAAKFTGVTVAPNAPPANVEPLTFLTTIQSYKDEAFKNGWITNAGVATSLDVKLNAAAVALQSGNETEARNQLKAFLNEVNAQSGKFLTAEAVGLLQANTEYLLAHM